MKYQEPQQTIEGLRAKVNETGYQCKQNERSKTAEQRGSGPRCAEGQAGQVGLDRWQDGVGEEKEGKGRVASCFLTWTSVFSR